MPTSTPSPHNVQQVVQLHSLLWLVVGNAVGIVLALLLIFPAWNAAFAPFNYGRLVTVHLNTQLYGWCSIPLLGLLFRMYLPAHGLRGWAASAVSIWSVALAFGVLSWLSGNTSGKLFMEWSGPSRVAITLSLSCLALVLSVSFIRRLLDAGDTGLSRPATLAKGAFLLLLWLVPPVMYWSANPAHYPPINPDSGGATGGSLLGSTLGIVAIIWVSPLVMGLQRQRGWSPVRATLALLLVHYAAFFLLDHGNHSHHERLQQVGLFSLLVWLPAFTYYFRAFTWPRQSKPWLIALCVWGSLLLATALFTFLPGILERWKFTNALVAHSHLAMAGMLTSFLVLILQGLDDAGPCSSALSQPLPFMLWHMGCLSHIGALMLLGTFEASHPALLFQSECHADFLYLLRLVGGLAMFSASLSWFTSTLRYLKESPS